VVVFNCIQETLDKTNLGQLKQGDRVNVERAMKLGDEFGGHQVMGHVDCIGTISKVVESPNNRQVFVRFEPVRPFFNYKLSAFSLKKAKFILAMEQVPRPQRLDLHRRRQSDGRIGGHLVGRALGCPHSRDPRAHHPRDQARRFHGQPRV